MNTQSTFLRLWANPTLAQLVRIQSWRLGLRSRRAALDSKCTRQPVHSYLAYLGLATRAFQRRKAFSSRIIKAYVGAS
jgi:hypothetical protein